MSKAHAIRLRRSTRALIDKTEPVLRKGFRDSIQMLRDDVVLKDLAAAIEKKNITAALKALHVEPAAFAPMRAAYRYLFEAGGNLTANTMPTLRKKPTHG